MDTLTDAERADGVTLPGPWGVVEYGIRCLPSCTGPCECGAMRAMAQLRRLAEGAQPSGAVEGAVLALEKDISDRRGLKHEWQLIDDDVKDEIRQAWRSIVAGALTATPSQPSGAVPWRCFHCDDVFTDEHAARLHFGPDEGGQPACKIKAGAEGGLLGALRRAEADAAAAWQAIHNETTDAAKAHYAQQDRHATQLRVVEEAGYERGLADGIALGASPIPPAEASAAPEPCGDYTVIDGLACLCIRPKGHLGVHSTKWTTRTVFQWGATPAPTARREK